MKLNELLDDQQQRKVLLTLQQLFIDAGWSAKMLTANDGSKKLHADKAGIGSSSKRYACSVRIKAEVRDWLTVTIEHDNMYPFKLSDWSAQAIFNFIENDKLLAQAFQ